LARISDGDPMAAASYAANTDAQPLLAIPAPTKTLLGRPVTKGLGAGALPQIGEQAAREAEDELKGALQGADIIFITCGLGGGTGTGGPGYIARLAKDMGGLNEAIVTPAVRGEGKM